MTTTVRTASAGSTAAAECQDCRSGWTGLDALAHGQTHAADTGHVVIGRHTALYAWGPSLPSRQEVAQHG